MIDAIRPLSWCCFLTHTPKYFVDGSRFDLVCVEGEGGGEVEGVERLSERSVSNKVDSV